MADLIFYRGEHMRHVLTVPVRGVIPTDGQGASRSQAQLQSQAPPSLSSQPIAGGLGSVRSANVEGERFESSGLDPAPLSRIFHPPMIPPPQMASLNVFPAAVPTPFVMDGDGSTTLNEGSFHQSFDASVSLSNLFHPPMLLPRRLQVSGMSTPPRQRYHPPEIPPQHYHPPELPPQPPPSGSIDSQFSTPFGHVDLDHTQTGQVIDPLFHPPIMLPPVQIPQVQQVPHGEVVQGAAPATTAQLTYPSYVPVPTRPVIPGEFVDFSSARGDDPVNYDPFSGTGLFPLTLTTLASDGRNIGWTEDGLSATAYGTVAAATDEGEGARGTMAEAITTWARQQDFGGSNPEGFE